MPLDDQNAADAPALKWHQRKLWLAALAVIIAGSTVLWVGPFPALVAVPAFVAALVAFVWAISHVAARDSELAMAAVTLIPWFAAFVSTEEWEKGELSRASEMTLGEVERCIWTPADYAGLVSYTVEGSDFTVLAAIDKGWSSCPPYITVEYATGRPLLSDVRSDVITVPWDEENGAPPPGAPARGR